MTVWPQLGACFVCLVFKSEMQQPEIVASFVTMQYICRVRTESFRKLKRDSTMKNEDD